MILHLDKSQRQTQLVRYDISISKVYTNSNVRKDSRDTVSGTGTGTSN